MGEAVPVSQDIKQEKPPKVDTLRARLLHNIPGGAPTLEVQKWNGKRWVHSHYEIYWSSKKYGNWFILE